MLTERARQVNEKLDAFIDFPSAETLSAFVNSAPFMYCPFSALTEEKGDPDECIMIECEMCPLHNRPETLPVYLCSIYEMNDKRIAELMRTPALASDIIITMVQFRALVEVLRDERAAGGVVRPGENACRGNYEKDVDS